MTGILNKIIQEQFAELIAVFSDLRLVKNKQDHWVVKGLLNFSANYKETTIKDCFEVELYITENYPDIPPEIKETGGRIPKEFHTFPKNNILCLGAPLDIKLKFAQNKSLLGFIKELVIPFLFSFCYFQKNGEMPYGELSHGEKGILEYYRDFFKVLSDFDVLGLLKILADNNYRGHLDCPCGSGEKVRNCHGHYILDIKKYQSQGNFIMEYLAVCQCIHESGETIPKNYLSKEVMKILKKTK